MTVLDDALWTRFVSELIARLPIDEARRREVAARFALACSAQALRACDDAEVSYPEVFGQWVRRVMRLLDEPSDAAAETLREATSASSGWHDTFQSTHAWTMVRTAVHETRLEDATFRAARTAVEAAVSIEGAARASGATAPAVRAQQLASLRGLIVDALRESWVPREDAWARVDELVRRTWPRWLVELDRHGDASELAACAAIVDGATLRHAVAIADARWPGLDAELTIRRDALRACSDRIERYTYRVLEHEYEDGNYTLVDYIHDHVRPQGALAFEAAATAIGTGASIEDAVDALVDATHLAACVNATIAAAVAARAVAIAAEARDQLTAGAVSTALRKR